MVARGMFCFRLGAFGVQAYWRTSEQGASQKGASFHERAASESVAIPIRIAQISGFAATPLFSKEKRMSARNILLLASCINLTVLMASCTTLPREKATDPAVTIGD